MCVKQRKTLLRAFYAAVKGERKKLWLTKGISHAAVLMAEGRTDRVGRKPRTFRAPSVKGLPPPLILCTASTATAAPREFPFRSTLTAARPLRRERASHCAEVNKRPGRAGNDA